MTVMAISTAKNNAELMVECRQLGYLRDEWFTLDPTWGLGRFWTLWQPDDLYASDIDPAKGVGVDDFTDLQWADDTFDAVVFDPPYKLNGTGGSHASDAAYGVAGKYVSWQTRHLLIRNGIAECARVLKPGGMLLIKCQDQVSSGHVRWQTTEFATDAALNRCDLIDMLHLQSYRAQPAGRRQVHARRNYSTLLVTQKDAS